MEKGEGHISEDVHDDVHGVADDEGADEAGLVELDAPTRDGIDAAIKRLFDPHASPDEMIDFDWARQWVGFSLKGNAKRLLTKNFEEGADYFTLVPKNKRSPKRGGQNKESIYLTGDTLKSFCMLAKTPRAKLVRLYFIEAEKEYQVLRREAQPAIAAAAEADAFALQERRQKLRRLEIEDMKMSIEAEKMGFEAEKMRVEAHQLRVEFVDQVDQRLKDGGYWDHRDDVRHADRLRNVALAASTRHRVAIAPPRRRLALAAPPRPLALPAPIDVDDKEGGAADADAGGGADLPPEPAVDVEAEDAVVGLIPPPPEEILFSDVVARLGVRKLTDGQNMVLGKKVREWYFGVYGHNPPQISRYFNNISRRTNSYTEEHRDGIASCIRTMEGLRTIGGVPVTPVRRLSSVGGGSVTPAKRRRTPRVIED